MDQTPKEIKQALLHHLKEVNSNPEQQIRHPEFRWNANGWQVLAYVLQSGTPSEKGYYFEAHRVEGRAINDIREENRMLTQMPKKYAHTQAGFDYYWAK